MAQWTFTTRDHKVFTARKDALSELAERGTLTKTLLDAEMTAYYDDGDYIEASIGFAWVLDKFELFTATAQRCGFTVEDFMREHGDNYWVGSRFLVHGKILAAIPQDRREQFVRDMHAAHGTFNNSWIPSVLDNGVSQSVVTDLILAGLRHSDDAAESRCVTSQASDFIKFGEGHSASDRSPWHMLDEEQLVEAFRICSGKAPRAFTQHRHHIAAAIGDKSYAELAQGTVLGLNKLSQEQVAFVRTQPASFQRDVASTLNEGADFIIAVAADLPEQEGLALMLRKQEVLKAGNTANLYIATWAARHRDGKPIAWLDQYFKTRLANEGYIFGKVEVNSFTPKGRPPQTELVVFTSGDGPRHKYVHDRRAKYQPQKDEVVLIDTRSPGNVALRSNVTATVFQRGEQLTRR